MSKKIRPSLKDYLRTGVVRVEDASREKVPETTDPTKDLRSEQAVPEAQAPDDVQEFFLSLLSKRDRETWQPVIQAGIELRLLPLDFVPVREDFRTADKNRFTFYILDRKGEPLRVARTSVQIRDPLELLLKWDETGLLTLYDPKQV